MTTEGEPAQTNWFRFWLWLIRFIGVIVPRRLRGDWRREWEAELLLRGSIFQPAPLTFQFPQLKLEVCEFHAGPLITEERISENLKREFTLAAHYSLFRIT